MIDERTDMVVVTPEHVDFDELERERDPVDRWVEALRSGKYKQGKNFLRVDDTFCCLGVACDLFDPDGWRRDDPVFDRAFQHHDDYVAGLPSDVKAWLGLATDLGGIVGANSLASQNDNGTSFAEIADLIESRPKGLFRS